MFPARNSSLLSWQWGVLWPPLRLFMFIHAQNVSLSPLTPLPPPSFGLPFGLLHLDHPLFSYQCLSYACSTQTLPVLQHMWWEMQSLWREVTGGGEKPGAGKSHDRSPGSGITKDICHIYQVFPPANGLHHLPTAHSPFPTLDQTFKRAELCFRPHFVGLSEAGTLAEQLSTKLFPPGLSKDLGVRGGWGHLQAWLLVHIQKWEHVRRSVSLSEAVYFILQWDFKSQAIR